MTLILILVFSLLGSVGSVLVASLLFLRRRELSPAWKTGILSYATGTLLAAALLGMIPHALDRLPARTALGIVLGGLIGFFLLEKLFVWRHCHESDCPVHGQAGPLILLGDGVHNFVDGVAIALAFLHSTPLGVATALAVVAHEIPQEIGDIMILVHGGWSRRRALVANFLVSLTTLAGAGAAVALGARITAFTPHALAVSAASFLYIALADLTPGHRSLPRPADSARQLAGLLAGIATILLVQGLPGH